MSSYRNELRRLVEVTVALVSLRLLQLKCRFSAYKSCDWGIFDKIICLHHKKKKMKKMRNVVFLH